MKYFSLFLFIIQIAWAQDTSKVQVRTYDDYPAKSFESKDVDAEQGPEKERSFIAELPSPARIKELIKLSGLESDTQGKDQIYFDILLSRLLRENFSETVKLYPKLDPEKLKDLKKLLEDEK